MESVAAEFGSISIRRIVWCFRKKDQQMNFSRLRKLVLVVVVVTLGLSASQSAWGAGLEVGNIG